MNTPGKACDIDGLKKEMWDIGSKFLSDDNIKNRFGLEADNVVKTIYEDVFDINFENRNAITYTKGTLKTFQRRLNRVKKAVEKDKLTGFYLPEKFGSLFYTPDAIAKSNPQLMDLYNNLHNVNLNYQGRVSRHNRSFKNIIDFMKKQMVIDGYVKEGMFQDRRAKYALNKAIKKATKLENEIEKLSIDVYNNVPGSKENLASLLRQEDIFYRKGEGKVFNDMLYTIEKVLPQLDYEAMQRWIKKSQNLKKRYSRAEYLKMRKRELEPILEDKIKSEPMKNAVLEYIDLSNEMYAVLKNGVDAYASSLRESMKNKYSTEALDGIIDKIKKKITPDKIRGYYPHYRRVLNVDFLDNLMPYMQKVSDSVSESYSKDASAVDKAIDDLDGYVTSRVKSREIIDLGEGVSAQKEYSRNFFVTMKRYVDEIDRFNMIANADKYTRQSLNAAKEMYKSGKDLDGYARSTVEMMKDMNARMKGGYGFNNESVEAAMKSLLALEFTSKLGLNPRSAFKNATQGLLNFIEFGPSIMKKSREFYKNNLDVARKVDDMMNEAGILFSVTQAPELMEGGSLGKGFSKKIKITDGETIEFKKPSMLSPLYGKISSIAGKSGIFMAKIENFNRKTTFKTGFYKMYDILSNSTEFKNKLRDEGKSNAEINAEILKRSRNYAIRKTSLLHFDYSEIAKSSWTLNPAGRLLGQFQHYGIKFLDYNMKLARQGKDDILAGELLGDRAKKAYSMGLIYFLAPTIATAATGLDFSNIIEHDTKEKIDKLWALFTGDEEDIKKAYYGKGILTGLPFIGAPLVSDAIALGNIWEFYNLDNSTLEMLISGYEDYSLASKDKKAYETLRLLNVAASRMAYKTLPMITSGNAIPALGYEFGFYKTKEAKKIKDDTKALLPDDVARALSLLQAHQKRATSKKDFTLERNPKGKGTFGTL